MENVDKKFKCGNLVLLRNLDNEFVFDKEWVFRRKCSLQLLLFVKFLNFIYEIKSLELLIKS